jgi:hypothetical protein
VLSIHQVDGRPTNTGCRFHPHTFAGCRDSLGETAERRSCGRVRCACAHGERDKPDKFDGQGEAHNRSYFLFEYQWSFVVNFQSQNGIAESDAVKGLTVAGNFNLVVIEIEPGEIPIDLVLINAHKLALKF